MTTLRRRISHSLRALADFVGPPIHQRAATSSEPEVADAGPQTYASFLPNQPFSTEKISICVGDVPALTAIQIEPTSVDFVGNDHGKRRSLTMSIVQWVTGQTLPAPITSGGMPSSEAVPVPKSPWLLCLPELFIPVDVFLDLVDAELPAGSMVLGGLTSLPIEGPSLHFFDSTALKALHVAATLPRQNVRFANIEFLTHLLATTTTNGGVVNLAASLVVDLNGVTVVVFHAKLAASKFERTLNTESNLIGATTVYQIELLSSGSANRRTTILPLICSDLFVVPESCASPIMGHLATDLESPVDLICVLNVQSLGGTAHLRQSARWPDEVIRVVEKLALREYGYYFECAQLLLTNVGSYRDESKLRDAGSTAFFVLGQNIAMGDAASHRGWLTKYSGVSRVYLKMSLTGVANGSYQWIDLAPQGQPPTAEGWSATGFFVAEAPPEVLASCQQTKCCLGKTKGRAAIGPVSHFFVNDQQMIVRANNG